MSHRRLSQLEKIQINFFPVVLITLVAIGILIYRQQSEKFPAEEHFQNPVEHTNGASMDLYRRLELTKKLQGIKEDTVGISTNSKEPLDSIGEPIESVCSLCWLAVDSLPYIVENDVFTQVRASEYFKTAAVLIQACPYSDEYVVSVINNDSLFYPRRWMTDAFWSTKHWVEALTYNDFTDGDVFLAEALGLGALVLDSLTKTQQLWKFKMDILSTLSIADSMKSVTGAEMKNVLEQFTLKQQGEVQPQ
jgi:hypothetical protein